MQKITIANIETTTGTNQKGPWTKTTITGADGLKASGFDSGLTSLKPGMAIEAEIEVKGKFTNIGRFTILSQGQALAPETKPAVNPQNGKPAYGRGPEERASIEKQTSIKAACDISSENETLDEILKKAERIYQWIHQTN